MAIRPRQQYYLANPSPIGEQIYGANVIKCVIADASPDIAGAEYAASDEVLCINKAWVVLDANGGADNGFLITTDVILAKLSP